MGLAYSVTGCGALWPLGFKKGAQPWARALGGMCAIGLVVPLSTNWIPAVKVNRKPMKGARPQGRAPEGGRLRKGP